MAPVTPRAAASLLVARDASIGPEIYMVRRHRRSAFLANATVFVGGLLDASDTEASMRARCSGVSPADAARRLGLDDEAVALGHYVAAIRECFEESGLLVARLASDPVAEERERLAQMLGRLRRKEASFSGLLAERGAVLALDELRHLDHWITPEFERRRYDAHFFVCRAPPGQEASFDPAESSAGGWHSPDEILEDNRAGRRHLAPPTLTLLERIRDCADVDTLLARAPDCPVAPTLPRPLLRGVDRPTLLFPDDHRYLDPGSRSGPLHYVEMRDGNWRRIRRG